MKLEENRAPDPKEESMAGDRAGDHGDRHAGRPHPSGKRRRDLPGGGAPLTGSAVITGSSQQIRLSSAMGSFPPWETREKNSLPGVQHIPVSGAHLNRAAAVDQLSREIEEGKHTIADLERCLDDIENMPGKAKQLLRSWRRQWEAAHSVCFSAGISWTARRHF